MNQLTMSGCFRSSVNERRWLTFLMTAAGIGLILLSGCSVQKMAMERLSGLFAQADRVFLEEEDPELAADAMPFTLKLMELLQRQDADNPSWYLSLGKGFVQYAYFLSDRADRIESMSFEQSERLRRRAAGLYRRALRYLLDGLEIKHPGLTTMLRTDPDRAVLELEAEDMEWIYWTAAAWGGWIGLSKEDPGALADLPQLTAMIRRGERLDPDWGNGAFHTLLIRFETSRPDADWNRAVERAWEHFRKAVLLGGCRDVSPFVVMAEAVAVQQQDVELFETLLRQALAVDPELYPENRLINELMQERARWLLERKAELFLIAEPESELLHEGIER